MTEPILTTTSLAQEQAWCIGAWPDPCCGFLRTQRRRRSVAREAATPRAILPVVLATTDSWALLFHLLGAFLFVGTQVADAPGARPRVFVSFAARSAAPRRPIAEAQRSVPIPFRAIVPLQRHVSEAARDAAGYLLVLLGVSAALVLARGPVLGAYRATNGGWRTRCNSVAALNGSGRNAIVNPMYTDDRCSNRP